MEGSNNFQPKKILFIMASLKQARRAEDSLKKRFEGLDFVHATGSAEALARCENTEFDMIVCDYYMPNFTGLEIFRNLLKKGNRKPFILIIDFQSQALIIDALKAGITDYIIMDVAFEEILPLVVEKNYRMHYILQHFEDLEKKLLESRHDQKDLATHDELTNLFNRRYAVKKLEEESDRSRRYDRPLSIMLIDIDHFRDVNDKYGFDMGNLILQKLSSILQKTLRKVDIVSRYEADAFLVILPETSVDKVSVVGEKITNEISSYIFNSKGSQFSVEVSIGISWFPRFGQKSYEELLVSAGKALASAKSSSGNRIKVAGKFIDTPSKGRKADK